MRFRGLPVLLALVACGSKAGNHGSTADGGAGANSGGFSGLADGGMAGTNTTGGTNATGGDAGTNATGGNAGTNAMGGTNATGGNAGTNAMGGTNATGGGAGTNATGGNAGTNAMGGNAGTNATGGNAGTNATGGNAGTNATGGNAGTNAMGGNAGSGVIECTSPYSAPRANYLLPVDATIAPVIASMSTQRRIDVINGGTELAGGNKYSADFDGTAATEFGLGGFAMRDGPRGVHQLNNGAPATTWAVAEARAASFDVDLETQVGATQGNEMLALKYDLALAPTMNVLRHPAWGRAQETYGEDPVLVGEMAAAFVNGMQANHQMMACPKSFALNDSENSRHYMNAVAGDQTERETYLRSFEIMIKKSDPSCIMAAYNRVGGLYNTENPKLLTDFLRTDLKWDGFTLSDWWATVVNDGAASLNAGLDYEMPDNQAFKTLPSDLASKSITVDRLNQAVTRMVNARIKFRQNTDQYKNAPANPGITNNQAHRDLARRTEEEGAVLLKNANFLPLGPVATTVGMGTASVSSIKFIGPDANIPLATEKGGHAGLGDGGTSNTIQPYAVSFAQGITQYAATNHLALTVSTSPNVADAAGADVVIIPITMWWADEGEGFSEGHDRSDLLLSGAHPGHWTTKPAAFIKQVAAVNPNIIVLLSFGSAVVMEDWFDSAKAVIQPFYPGQEGGAAIAELLFGKLDFTGRLPFTIAASPADYPVFNNNNVGDVPIDYFHGYRKIEHDGKTPTFWFGEGLSYNTYTFSNLTLGCSGGQVDKNSALNATITVKNNGQLASAEVVQAYVGYPNTKVVRPVKELKTFTRVNLQPGESNVVTITIPVEDMAYWQEFVGWTVETGIHTLYVGSSAKPADLQSVDFTIN